MKMVTLIRWMLLLGCVTGPNHTQAALPIPPQNPYLSDGATAGVHRNSYSQQASPLPGPESEVDVTGVDYLHLGGLSFPMQSPAYSSGERRLWASASNAVGKLALEKDGIRLVHKVEKPAAWHKISPLREGILDLAVRSLPEGILVRPFHRIASVRYYVKSSVYRSSP